MTDYIELVKALRCELHYTSCPETNCKYICHDTYCDTYRLMIDAAAAIEALQAQLPKRGEWVRVEDEESYWTPMYLEGPDVDKDLPWPFEPPKEDA